MVSLNETGFETVRLAQAKTFANDTNEYIYRYRIDNITNGWQFAVAVTSFDRGNEENNLESLESSLLANNFRVFPGTRPNSDIKKMNLLFIPPLLLWSSLGREKQFSRKKAGKSSLPTCPSVAQSASLPRQVTLLM